MTTTFELTPASATMTREAGGWIAYRVPQADVGLDAIRLLAMSAAPHAGNLRVAMEEGRTCMLGELRDPDGLLTLAEAHDRMFAADDDWQGEVSREEVACALGESGFEWSQLEGEPSRWKAAAHDPRGSRCELQATIIANGVEVRGLILSTGEDELAASSQLALSRFFVAAHSRVRFARFTLQPGEARAVSFAAASRLEIELSDSIAAVLAACRLVGREVLALTDATVAEAYLESSRQVSHVGQAEVA
jgi:hypothetical protein